MVPLTETTETEISHIQAGRVLQRDNGIVYFYMNNDLSINLTIAEEAVEKIHTADDSGQTRLLIIMGFNIDVEFAAQRYFSSAIGAKKLAMVVQNKIQIEVARFLTTMMKLFDCAYELKSFYTVEQAEKWLLED